MSETRFGTIFGGRNGLEMVKNNGVPDVIGKNDYINQSSQLLDLLNVSTVR